MSAAPSARLDVRGLRSAIAGPSTLAVAPGGCAAITGPSGSGKSLFLRMLADLDPNEGEVTLDGCPRAGFTAPQWRCRVTYVPAEAGWWADLAADHFPARDLPRARDLAQALGVGADQLGSPVARLSTGERQRLALVRAVLLDPAVLLLDEPTGALDAASTGRVELMLRARMAEGAAVVLVTHDVALAERLATVRYHMSERRLVAA